MNLRVRRMIPAPIDVVWRALTDPEEVSAWAEVVPVRLRRDYPAAGEHALWRVRNGVLLHDEILNVVDRRELVSRLRTGPWLAIETYRIAPAGPGATTLLADWRGNPALVAGNDELMHRMIRAAGARVRSAHGTQSGDSRGRR